MENEVEPTAEELAMIDRRREIDRRIEALNSEIDDLLNEREEICASLTALGKEERGES